MKELWEVGSGKKISRGRAKNSWTEKWPQFWERMAAIGEKQNYTQMTKNDGKMFVSNSRPTLKGRSIIYIYGAFEVKY